MGIRRIVFVGVMVVLALGGTSALAAGMCQEDLLTSYLVSGFSCTQDNGLFIFKGFTFSGPQNGLNADQISLTPLDMPGKFGFMINGNFTVGQGQTASYTFGYFIDPPPVIHGDQIELDPTGLVTLQTDLCKTAFPCAVANMLGTLTATTANPTAATTFPSDLSALGVRNTLTLNGAAGPATSGGFSNTTLVASASPEPASIVLAASGLFGLLAFRARTKFRKIRF